MVLGSGFLLLYEGFFYSNKGGGWTIFFKTETNQKLLFFHSF